MGRRPDRENHRFIAVAKQFSFADRNFLDIGIEGDAQSRTPWKADCGGTRIIDRRSEQMLQFVLVLRRHHDRGRQHPEIGEVEESLMRCSVGTHQTRAVQSKGHIQILQTDIVNDLIEGALQKGRVDRGHRLHAFGGETGGECDRMLLGDPDIVETVGMGLLESVEPGSRCHRRRDRDDPFVFARQSDQSVREDTGKGGRRFLLRSKFARGNVELPDAVVLERIRFCRTVTMAFLGQCMDQDGPGPVGHHFFHVVEGLEHHIHAMTLDRSDITKSKRFE